MNDIDVNLSSCLVPKEHFGYTTYVNICNGGSNNVAWTALDWSAAAFLATLVLLAVGLIGLIIYGIKGEM